VDPVSVPVQEDHYRAWLESGSSGRSVRWS
jgi:hypothetical protein